MCDFKIAKNKHLQHSTPASRIRAQQIRDFVPQIRHQGISVPQLKEARYAEATNNKNDKGYQVEASAPRN